MKLNMWATHLTRGSSPVDWCEDNYSFSPLIGTGFKNYTKDAKERNKILTFLSPS